MPVSKRFEVLSDKPTGSGLGPISFGQLSGYQVGDFNSLDEARGFVATLRTVAAHKGARIHIVDRTTWNGKTIKVLFDSNSP